MTATLPRAAVGMPESISSKRCYSWSLSLTAVAGRVGHGSQLDRQRRSPEPNRAERDGQSSVITRI